MTASFNLDMSLLENDLERELQRFMTEDVLQETDNLGYRRMMVTDVGSGTLGFTPRTNVNIEPTLKQTMDAHMTKVAIAAIKRGVRKEYVEKLTSALSHITNIKDAECYPTEDRTSLVVAFKDSKLVIELGENAFLFNFEAFYSSIAPYLLDTVKRLVGLYNKECIKNISIEQTDEITPYPILAIDFIGSEVTRMTHILKRTTN